MPDADILDAPPAPYPGARRAECNVVPAWVLPLMRLRRGVPGAPLAAAWRRLPLALPAGVAMPGEEEAAVVLIALGLA